MNRRMNPATLIGLIVLFTFGGQALPLFLASPENRWTPRQLARTLEQTDDRVRVFVDGEPLTERLEAGDVYVADGEGVPRPVEPGAMRVRINHWPEVRGQLMVRAVFLVAGAAIGLTLLIVGLFILPRFAARDEANQPLQPPPGKTS
jgi:hypothetical protein